MIFMQSGYSPGDNPPGVPLIGHDNKVVNVVTSSAATGFPAINLLNSATHLFWRAGNQGEQLIGITTSGSCNYIAFAGQNFADDGTRIALLDSANNDAINGYLTVLMHFEGTNGGTDYFDTSGHDVAFAPSGATGLLTTAQFKFGTMSINFDGTNNVIGGQTAAAGTGDFTYDFWVRINATGANYFFLD